LIEHLEEIVARKPWHVLAAVAILTAVAAVGAAGLDIKTSRTALFPQDAPVMVRLNSFLEKFGAGSDLMVVVEGAPRTVLEPFATEFATRLRKLPGVRDASERIDTDFFYRHAFLMLPQDSLAQIRSKLKEFKGKTFLKKPVTTDEALSDVSDWLDNPPTLGDQNVDIKTGEATLKVLDFLLAEWDRWLVSKDTPTSIDWPRLANNPEANAFLEGNGYFASHDGSFLIVLVSRSNLSEEFNVLDPFIQDVRKTADTLRAEYRAEGKPVPTIGLTGLPAIVHEEYSYVRSDILFIVATAGVMVMLLILFWMRSLKRALVIFIPMGIGTIWNAGIVYLTVGHLTMVTAGFSAILFGLGVDYGIFMSSRILEEVRKGVPLTEAIVRGSTASAGALFTAGGCTILIFGVLITVPFKGFAELGSVAATGVLSVLASTFLTLPALFAVLKPPLTTKGPGRTLSEQEARRPLLTLSRPASLLVVIFAFAAAGIGIAVGATLPFNYNSMDLLPKDSEAARYQKKLVEQSDFQPELIIFTAPNLKEARRITREASNIPTISRVQSIVDLFPDDMDERVEVAHRIGRAVGDSHAARVIAEQKDVNLTPDNVTILRGILEKALDLVDDIQEQAFTAGQKGIVEVLEKARGRIEKLSAMAQKDPKLMAARTDAFFNLLLASTRKTVDVLAGWKNAKPLTPARLPASLRDRFIASDGSWAIYAYPRFSVYHLEMLDVLLKDVYAVSKDATGFPTTHQVFSRMAINSFIQGTLLAALVALIWIFLAVRNFRGFLIAALPLIVGEGWMLGIMAFFDIEFGYANIIGVPMVMALAVDYGVWFAHRFKELPDLDPWQAASIAARAIMLAAGTTLAGLGAITLAKYRGVSMMGVCITIGLVCCVIAARVVSPAVAHIMRGKPNER